MYELKHEGDVWNLYYNNELIKKCNTIEEGVEEIERLKGKE